MCNIISGKEDKLNTWKVLSGHKGTVLQLMWNPHIDEVLMSSSQDATVRVSLIFTFK